MHLKFLKSLVFLFHRATKRQTPISRSGGLMERGKQLGLDKGLGFWIVKIKGMLCF